MELSYQDVKAIAKGRAKQLKIQTTGWMAVALTLSIVLVMGGLAGLIVMAVHDDNATLTTVYDLPSGGKLTINDSVGVTDLNGLIVKPETKVEYYIENRHYLSFTFGPICIGLFIWIVSMILDELKRNKFQDYFMEYWDEHRELPPKDWTIERI